MLRQVICYNVPCQSNRTDKEGCRRWIASHIQCLVSTLAFGMVCMDAHTILQFLLVWGSWYGQTRSYPRFFGYRPEQYVKLTSRVTANSRLILDISGIIAQVLDIMGLDVIPPSMLQFPFSLVPLDLGRNCRRNLTWSSVLSLCYMFCICISENQTSGTVHCNCFQNNVEVT